MKLKRIAVVTAALVAVLVLGLVGAGGWYLSQTIWSGPVQAQGPITGWVDRTFMGGMMGGNGFWGGSDGDAYAPCWVGTDGNAPLEGSALTIEQAAETVESYLARAGYGDLSLTEVMEFQHNFYAIATEDETGIGAMELLIDKQTGAVGPEYGPNMMWNTKYGMHGGGMGGMMWGNAPAEITMTAEEALGLAQRWLDTYRPGMTTEEHADPFYGYYTIHTLRDGRIAGMLSVHGGTGQVWYHSWHGDFIDMIEGIEH